MQQLTAQPAREVEAPTEHAETTADQDAGGGHDRARLRDLSRSERWLAALLGVAVAMPTIVALVHFGPGWAPAGDAGFMALRTLDVGTSRNPLTGQPSSSAVYGGIENHVNHLGALHFYVMAPFARLMGLSAGMLAVSAITSIFMALVTLWVVFRNIGKTAAVVAAAVLSAVLFGMGAGRLLDPVSSAYSGPCLLASAVLAWAVLCGDFKLFPLAAGVLTYTIQIHLAVGPASALLMFTAFVAMLIYWWRRRRQGSRDVGRSLWLGVGVALLLFVPALYQEITDDPGNLTALWDYAGDSDAAENNLGLTFARAQLVHTLSLPPLFFSTNLTGEDLIVPRSGVDQFTALVVVVAVLGALVWWGRRRDRKVSLAVMAVVLGVAGVISGSRVPGGFESGRLALYQWVWALTFFVWLSLLLAGRDLVRSWAAAWGRRRQHGPDGGSARRWIAAQAAVVAVAVVAIAVPIINNSQDRVSNSRALMHMEYEGEVYRQLTDDILDADAEIPDGRTLITLRDTGWFPDLEQGLAAGLQEQGLRVLLEPRYEFHLHEDRTAQAPQEVDVILIAAVQRSDAFPVYEGPGRVLASWIWPEGANGSSFGNDPERIDIYMVADPDKVNQMTTNLIDREPLLKDLDDL